MPEPLALNSEYPPQGNPGNMREQTESSLYHSTHLAMLYLPFFYGATQDSDFLPKPQTGISARTLLLLEFILNYPMPLCLRANPEEVKRIHDYNFLPLLSSPLLSCPLLFLVFLALPTSLPSTRILTTSGGILF